MDRRDDLTWIAIELSPQGENKVDDGTLEKSLRQDLKVGPDFPIFIPATTYTKDGKTTTIQLMEGYVFVGSGLPETAYFALEGKPYVQQVMSTISGPYHMRVLSTIPNIKIIDLKRQLRDLSSAEIEIDDEVVITDGTYQGLNGKVVARMGDQAQVKIDLRSLKVIVTVPVVFLDSGVEHDK